MATQDPAPPQQPDVAHPYSPSAAFLSYLIPGLGQIVQGRVAKGVLFLVCLYGLFFFGMYLGDWRNVYVPAGQYAPDGQTQDRFLDSLLNKARFGGQFWIGVAAWPAIIQYNPLQPLARFSEGYGTRDRETGKWIPDAGGRMVRPVRDEAGNWTYLDPVPPHPWFGTFMREPDERDQIEIMRNSNKNPDLGWMYTVIAGVLNILVIYDAFAGPAYGVGGPRPEQVFQQPAQTIS